MAMRPVLSNYSSIQPFQRPGRIAMRPYGLVNIKEFRYQNPNNARNLMPMHCTFPLTDALRRNGVDYGNL
jgi:hypothetical protein